MGLVTRGNFNETMELLCSARFIALDTETTGLRIHHNDRLFSIVASTATDNYYFNFKSYPSEQVEGLPREWIKEFNNLRAEIIYFANAKFDLHTLARDAVHLHQRKWDVLVVAKCLYNTHMSYSLDSVAARLGFEKLKTVEDYIAKHKLFTIEKLPGKKTRTKNKHYDMVPLEIMQPYAERDSRITFDIGEQQRLRCAELEMFAIKNGYPSFNALIDREMRVTEVCYAIEKTGMEINGKHLCDALAHEQARALVACDAFTKISATPFVDSNKALKLAFGNLGISGGITKKGNASFTDKVLEGINHPLGEAVREYRDATKRANTYYQGFLSHADKDGIIHPSIRQTGADTFRFSITDPALQTLNAKETGQFKVRDSFMARIGTYLVAIDYKQQEYRLAADYAGEMALIKKIQAGVDVHTATADLMGVGRDAAKTLNFMLLYGGGVAKLCLALFAPTLSEMGLKAITWRYIYKSWPKEEGDAKIMQAEFAKLSQAEITANLPLLQNAYNLQQKYFSSLTKTKQFIDEVTKTAKEKGQIYNWAGRRLLFPNKRFAYKAPNHLIQSSGAEIMRCALIELHDFFIKIHAKTKILLSIHDEILLEMPPEEFDLIPKIREIMVNVYKPINGLMMDTSVKYGLTWAAMKEEQPV